MAYLCVASPCLNITSCKGGNGGGVGVGVGVGVGIRVGVKGCGRRRRRQRWNKSARCCRRQRWRKSGNVGVSVGTGVGVGSRRRPSGWARALTLAWVSASDVGVAVGSGVGVNVGVGCDRGRWGRIRRCRRHRYRRDGAGWSGDGQARHGPFLTDGRNAGNIPQRISQVR